MTKKNADGVMKQEGLNVAQRRSARLAEKAAQPEKAEPEKTGQHHETAAEPDTVSSGSLVLGEEHVAATFDDGKQSVALKAGLHGLVTGVACPDKLICELHSNDDISGLWGLLPEELIETTLKLCTSAQLGMLETTCKYFRCSKLIDKIAKQRLRAIPRAKGLRPIREEKETNLALLHFVNSQSAAAAQATAIACGGHHTSALLIERKNSDADGGGRHSLYSFGRNFHGQLGLPDFADKKTPAAVSLGFRPCLDNPYLEEETMPAVVACGTHHSTCISRRGELFSWGFAKHGELGQGGWTPVEVSIPKQCPMPLVRIVSVACGASHTLAIGESGSLWSCGRNSSGQLGLGNVVDHTRLQMVQHIHGVRIVSAAAGLKHSVALASDGSMYTWGDGSRGQLGHPELEAAPPQVQQNIALAVPAKIVRLDPSKLEPECRVTAVSAGNFHTMALTVGGSILAFGSNDTGCLGLGDYEDRWRPTEVILALDGEKGVCLRAVQLACGAGHSVALFSRQGCLEVRSTGSNVWGQLGHGDRLTRCRFTPTQSVGCITAVQAGDEHCAAVNEAGVLYTWGRGDSGQLGHSDGRARWRPIALKGFLVVHPDKTLRRSKRNQPFVRHASAHDCKRLRMSRSTHYQ